MKDEINREFGTALRVLRHEKGLRRYELAIKVGISPDTIGLYERGEGGPSLVKASEIAAIFGMTVDGMLERGGA